MWIYYVYTSTLFGENTELQIIIREYIYPIILTELIIKFYSQCVK